MFLLNPKDITKEAAKKGLRFADIEVPATVILTFSGSIVSELTKQCDLKDWRWLGSNFSPYAQPIGTSLKGTIDGGDEIAVFFPPMGASPLVAFCEELIYFGAKRIILACASWGLNEQILTKGQILLPTYAVGIDGTSVHYGNQDWKVDCEPESYHALKTALKTLGSDWKEGGVGTCEAIYRITEEMIEEYKSLGCLSLENGEVAALYSLAKSRKVQIGVIMQPNINLEKGWSVGYMNKKYVDTCKLQAQVAVEALRILLEGE